jgi:hypothetical protein
MDFINNNNFTTTTTTTKDPTNTFLRELRKNINDSQSIIYKDIKRKYINLNPLYLRLFFLIKIRKTNTRIRLIVY